MHCLSFSILKSLLPSLNTSDICDVREARPKLAITNTENPISYKNNFTSIIVRLKTADLVRKIMLSKKSYNNNYFSTKNIDQTLLNSEIATALPNSRIFINEVLSTSDRLLYLSIKDTAKSLGFKYVWHCSGKFLVRWADNCNSHLIRSLSDLTLVTKSLGISRPFTCPQSNSYSNNLPHTFSNNNVSGI